MNLGSPYLNSKNNKNSIYFGRKKNCYIDLTADQENSNSIYSKEIKLKLCSLCLNEIELKFFRDHINNCNNLTKTKSRSKNIKSRFCCNTYLFSSKHSEICVINIKKKESRFLLGKLK